MHLTARSFRNLADLDLELPTGGAVFLGANAHGKTSLLECLDYPVLFRSFRAATDQEVGRWGGAGFRMCLAAEIAGDSRRFEIAMSRLARRKQIRVDGVEVPKLNDAVGQWITVTFLPSDLRLIQGGASERRRYLDRALSLADPGYLRSLWRYRATLAQRNAALRARRGSVARAFDGTLAEAGAGVVAKRERWVAAMQESFSAECDALGESGPVTLAYRGGAELSDPAAWPAALDLAAGQELARGATLVGPHRDDLRLEREGRALRDYGSTGQQRTAAVALRLCERATLRTARGAEPVLLLDDVFAELDGERQDRLASRLAAAPAGQVFVTAPRRDELPRHLSLEQFELYEGLVRAVRIAA